MTSLPHAEGRRKAVPRGQGLLERVENRGNPEKVPRTVQAWLASRDQERAGGRQNPAVSLKEIPGNQGVGDTWGSYKAPLLAGQEAGKNCRKERRRGNVP
jgi:hypothetical protein